MLVTIASLLKGSMSHFTFACSPRKGSFVAIDISLHPEEHSYYSAGPPLVVQCRYCGPETAGCFPVGLV